MLGAIFQCYSEPFATYKTLESFRRIYPTAHVVVINDGAPEALKPKFEAIASHFHIDYLYEDKRSFSADETNGVHMNQKEAIVLYAKRFAWSIKRLSEPYFVILEDDVLFLRAASPETWKYEINGCNPNVYFGPEAVEHLQNVRRDITTAQLPVPKAYYGACGGCVLNTKFFQDATKNIDAVLDAFCEVVPSKQWACDTFISFLCYSEGGMIGVNPEFCETWYRNWFDRVVLNKIAILHKIKLYYGVPFPVELEKHCNENEYDGGVLDSQTAEKEVFNLISSA